MVLVGQIIIRDVVGDPTFQNMGKLGVCLDIHSNCTWIMFGGVKYQTKFSKNKKRFVLTNVLETNDLEIESKVRTEAIVNEMNMRIADINHLEEKIQSLCVKLSLPSSRKETRKDIINEINLSADLVQNHKSKIHDRHVVNFACDVEHTRTTTTTRISMRHGVRYKIGTYLVTWVHYTMDIHKNNMIVSNDTEQDETRIYTPILPEVRQHINKIIHE